MNTLDWEDAAQRLQPNLHPNHWSGVNNSMEKASVSKNAWDTYCEYTDDVPQSNVSVRPVSPPSQDFYMKESEAEDPDGEPLEMEEEDLELARKRKELQEIEEQILRKKVAIALKKVEPLVKEIMPPGFSRDEQSATCDRGALKDRVNVILQQRHSDSFLSTVQSRLNSPSLRKDGLLQEHHPLKLRVKALMKQRCTDLCVIRTNREVADVTPSPPTQTVTSPAKEESNVNKGFQRFLSVLNKGVDMDWLSRIVNDDSEDLPLGEELLNLQTPAVESKSDPPFRSEGQRSNSGASLLAHSQTSSEERKADLPSGERSPIEKLSLPDVKEQNSRGESRFGSSSRSRSLAVKKKKDKEEKTKEDEQRAQLQSVLKTLGLSLEVEEMSRLADRTQERLYGKKHEGAGGQESRQRDSHRHCRSSSSSSSSSYSSSRSSRSCISSPSRCGDSHNRDSDRRRTSECRRSRDRGQGGLTCKDSDSQYSDKAQRHMHGDRKDSTEALSTYQHQYTGNQMSPCPTAFSVFPHYSLSQYSEYNNCHSDTYTAATDAHWTFTQESTPPSLHHSEYPYPQSRYDLPPSSAVAPSLAHHRHFEDTGLFENPDLSRSEGQVGSVFGTRCLQVIRTKQQTQRNIGQPKKGRKRKGKSEAFKKKRSLRRKQKLALKRLEKNSAGAVVKVNTPQNHEDEAKQSAMQSAGKSARPSAMKSTAQSARPPAMKSTAKSARPPAMKSTAKSARPPAMKSTAQSARLSVMKSTAQSARPSVMQSARPPAVQSPVQSARPCAVQSALQSARSSAVQSARSSAVPSNEEKPQPTEEQIKENLRKKLAAFNQMVKQRVPQPANFLSTQTDFNLCH